MDEAGERESDGTIAQRRADRLERPLSCEVEIDGKSHSAVIRNLTLQGLFVTCRFSAGIDDPVVVRVRRPGGVLWEIEARVARCSDGARSLISERGFGLEILEAPAGFHSFVASLAN